MHPPLRVLSAAQPHYRCGGAEQNELEHLRSLFCSSFLGRIQTWQLCLKSDYQQIQSRWSPSVVYSLGKSEEGSLSARLSYCQSLGIPVYTLLHFLWFPRPGCSMLSNALQSCLVTTDHHDAFSCLEQRRPYKAIQEGHTRNCMACLEQGHTICTVNRNRLET